jgi:hypothetical protein
VPLITNKKTARPINGPGGSFTFKLIRSTENLKHQTNRSGGDGENDEVLQFERTLGRIVANDHHVSIPPFAILPSPLTNRQAATAPAKALSIPWSRF